MRRLLIIVVSFFLVLMSGCADNTFSRSSDAVSSTVEYQRPVVVAPTPVPQPEVKEDSTMVRIKLCRKELEAMKTYNMAVYNQYHKEFLRVSAETAKYLKVKGTISPDVNDVVMPRYQFAIRDFCFRTKNKLAKLIINQVTDSTLP